MYKITSRPVAQTATTVPRVNDARPQKLRGHPSWVDVSDDDDYEPGTFPNNIRWVDISDDDDDEPGTFLNKKMPTICTRTKHVFLGDQKLRSTFALLDHQKMGIGWMKEKEVAHAGGLLADEMGLGKTIQVLAYFLSHPVRTDEAPSPHKGFPVPSNSTLIVAPVSLIKQWVSEVPKVSDTATAILHHGPKRIQASDKLRQHDFIITSYATLAQEYDNYVAGRKSKPQALFNIIWARIVLDEAHTIKNHRTQAAKACFALVGSFRWCVTGTPIQNRADELYSIVKFLKFAPYDDLESFNKMVTRPVKSSSIFGKCIIKSILEEIMIRRTKDQKIGGRPILRLPPRFINHVICEFSAVEREFYTGLEAKFRMVVGELMQSERMPSSYSSILTLLVRLRQACCHPTLVFPNLKITLKQDGDARCGLCNSIFPDSLRSAPAYCHTCCELRHLAFTLERKDSSKLCKLTETLKAISQRSQGTEKTIIFSEFKAMLCLVGNHLETHGIGFVSCLNITACNNIVLLDLPWNPAVEDQAFARAHRIGQTRAVNVYKLAIPGTVEDRILHLQDGKRRLARDILGRKLNSLVDDAYGGEDEDDKGENGEGIGEEDDDREDDEDVEDDSQRHAPLADAAHVLGLDDIARLFGFESHSV
ncbi:SNF2 family N-terminal domain-containing protein [Lyophyllum atratum]|nr:SNF2 family N-terminal domain-containing protein [Lyophyllum atratum]